MWSVCVSVCVRIVLLYVAWRTCRPSIKWEGTHKKYMMMISPQCRKYKTKQNKKRLTGKSTCYLLLIIFILKFCLCSHVLNNSFVFTSYFLCVTVESSSLGSVRRSKWWIWVRSEKCSAIPRFCSLSHRINSAAHPYIHPLQHNIVKLRRCSGRIN